jgi:hypothetical protein
VTKQEIYDRVLIHLRAQRIASMGAGACAYVNAVGHTCAIGCLMSRQDAVLAERRGGAVAFLMEELPEVYSRIDPDGENLRMLQNLQACHDSYMPRNKGEKMASWEDHMQNLATAYNLIYVPNLGDLQVGMR